MRRNEEESGQTGVQNDEGSSRRGEINPISPGCIYLEVYDQNTGVYLKGKGQNDDKKFGVDSPVEDVCVRMEVQWLDTRKRNETSRSSI